MVVNYKYKLPPFNHQAEALGDRVGSHRVRLVHGDGNGQVKSSDRQHGYAVPIWPDQLRLGHRTKGRVPQLGSQRNPRAYVR